MVVYYEKYVQVHWKAEVMEFGPRTYVIAWEFM